VIWSNYASSCSGRGSAAGTVDAILCRVADALVDPCEDLLDRLRASKTVNMDETGWRTAGQRRALWGIFDQRHAYLHVATDRQAPARRHQGDRDQ
jgi:hypothetical protein